MPGRKKLNEYKESQFANDLAQIMAAGKGPYTRSMLATELSKLHPAMYWRDLMNEVSCAIQMDKWAKAHRFKPVKDKKGWYELNKKAG